MHIDARAGVSAAQPSTFGSTSAILLKTQAKRETAARVRTVFAFYFFFFFFFNIRGGAAYVQEHHIKLLTNLQVPQAFIRIIKRLPGSLRSLRRSA